MSGTNTICVVTAAARDRHGAHAEPVTELCWRRPPGWSACGPSARRQGHRGHLRERARPSPRTWTGRWRCRSSGTVTVDVAWGGMFYVIADAAPFGLRLTPDEGARHRAHRRDDQGRGAGAAARRAPGEPGHRRHHHRRSCPAPPARPTPPPRTRWWSPPASWTGTAGHLDRRHRPLAVRHRHLRQDGHAARQGQAGPLNEDFAHEGILGTIFTGRLMRETPRRPLPGRGPDHQRQRLDHRHRPVRGGSPRSVPRRVHGRGHLGCWRRPTPEVKVPCPARPNTSVT